MNHLRKLMFIALVATGASASEPRDCNSALNIADVAPAMGDGVAIQPVFSGGGIKGWRLYNVHKSAQLTSRGIQSGALMTHVCGVPAREITANEGQICCSMEAASEFEVTFEIKGQETKIMIKRTGS